MVHEELELSFLPDGQITSISDDNDLNPVQTEVKLKAKKPYQFEIKPSGATILISKK